MFNAKKEIEALKKRLGHVEKDMRIRQFNAPITTDNFPWIQEYKLKDVVRAILGYIGVELRMVREKENIELKEIEE